tara:strand:- start:4090 stop:5040 length:951 start_codon:yes stop_codon:yes gene_type:complete
MNTELLPPVADAVLIWCSVFALSSITHALFYPPLQRRSDGVSAASAADLRLLWGFMPPIAASAVTLLVLNPALSAPLIPGHCHGLNCAPHPPLSEAHPALRVGMAAVTGGLALTLCAAVALLAWRVQRRLRTLLSLSRAAATQRFQVIDVPGPAAWCVGWWRPQVYVSRSMLDALSAQELRVVLEHEYAHQRRRDNLRRAALAIATVLWPRSRRQQLLSDYHTATEMACDWAAVDVSGDADLVARVIARLEGLPAAAASEGGATGSASAARSRIKALLAAPRNTASPRLLLAIVGLWLLQIWAGTALAHACIELLS